MSDEKAPEDRYDAARAILLKALDDLDGMRAEGRTLSDFVIAMIGEAGADSSHIYTGLSVAGSIRLGTWSYFYHRELSWLNAVHWNEYREDDDDEEPGGG